MNFAIDLTSVPLSKSATTADLDFRPLLQETDIPGDYVIQIDNSSLELFVSCPRKTMFQHILGWRAPGRSALVYGDAIHRALEARYKSQLTDHFGLCELMNTEVDKAFTSPVGIDEWRTPSQAKETCRRYLLEYAAEDLDIVHKDNIPFVEVPFSQYLGKLEIGGDDIRIPDNVDPHNFVKRIFGKPARPNIQNIHVFWTGKIDLVLRRDSQIFVMDHKTTSVLGESFWKQFDLSMPQQGYCWATSKILGEQITGTIINAIVGRRPTKTGTALEFHRRTYVYPSWQLEDWPQNCIKIVRSFIEQLLYGDFPGHYKDCVNMYGVCPFHAVCTIPPNQREMLLRSAYEQNNWSPLK